MGFRSFFIAFHFVLFFVLSPFLFFGQEHGVSALYESYLGYDLNGNCPKQHAYIYNHYYLRSPRINYAQIDWKKSFKAFNLQLGIQDGDYVRRNYSDQPKWAQLISVAQVQYNPKMFSNLKCSLGIFPSHIGFESAWAQNNLTLTRSLLAENSPYFESGAHFQYNGKNGKWSIGGLILTGWQQAHLATPVKKPSFGWSSNFVLNDNFQFSYNGFWGYQNVTGLMKRSYHNLYSNFTCKSWKGVLGFDFGTAILKGDRVEWYSPVLILSKFINNQWNAAFRIESMKDSKSFILFNDNQLLFQKSSLGLNLDYKTEKQWMLRFEIKQVFEKMDLNQKNQNTLLMVSVSKATLL